MEFAFYLVCGVLAVFVGAWLFRKDTEKENRRKAAINSAAVAREFGLSHLPNLLTCYAVGDYSGMAQEVKRFAELAGDPALLAMELDKVLKAVVQKKASTPEGKAHLSAMLEGK